MIDKAEIEAKAKEFEINPANVQRDYVFGWILFALFTQGALKDRLFLKGGNDQLQRTQRFSFVRKTYTFFLRHAVH